MCQMEGKMESSGESLEEGGKPSLTDQEKKYVSPISSLPPHLTSSRRLRNRLSQRAFRRRQAECIRDLQNRVNTADRPDSDRVEVLQRENKRLRSQLVDVQAKMNRLLATMQTLNESVSKTLDDVEDEEQPDEQPLASEMATPRPSDTRREESFPSQLEAIDSPFPDFSGSMSQNIPARSDSFSSTELINVAGTSPMPPQIPNIWSFEYQMGVQPYMNAMNATERSSITLGKEWSLSNSPFSDHIQLLQSLLKSKLNVLGFIPQGNHIQSLYQPVLMVLSMFNSMTRPDVMAWYAKTRFFHIIELTAWQLYPSSATFEKLHPRYRPTNVQLNNQHPRVIDWIPFPSIRDRCIQLHAADPQVDQIFCDAVTGYTVETMMSELILGAPQIMVYIRVTDLITAMSTSSDKYGEDATLPAPDINTLFSSPAYARAAFKKLNMDKGASYYKIDPAFFQKYPELFDPSNDSTATGIPLRPKLQKILTYPRPLDATTVDTYRSFIDFSLDATNSITMSGTL